MPIKVLVAVKRVVDPYVKIHVRKDESGVEVSNVKRTMNPFDEIAIEQAIQWKEKGMTEEVVAVSCGPAAVSETLLNALARGADRAIAVECEESIEPLGVAKILSALIDKEKPDVVLLGKQAIDDDCNQVGQMLAALQDWPQATFASEVALTDNALTVTREVDGGLQTLQMPLPAVVTTDLRLNEPRYVALPNIMKAKRKPMEKITAESLGVDTTPRLHVKAVKPPQARKSGIKVDSVEALVDCLKNKEKVI